MVTRPSKPENLSAETVWQNGPSFLSGPKETWPISQKPYEHELPDRCVVGLTMTIPSDQDFCNDVKINNFSSFDKLMRVTARVPRSAENRSLRGIGQPLQPELISKAETLWIKHAQKQLLDNWQKRFRRLGPSLNSEGILIVGSRISKWLKDNWNQNCFILLPEQASFNRSIGSKTALLRSRGSRVHPGSPPDKILDTGC